MIAQKALTRVSPYLRLIGTYSRRAFRCFVLLLHGITYLVRICLYLTHVAIPYISPHWLKVYPSERFQNQYTSNEPLIFTIVAVSIFAFTSLVFIVYDFMVETRQKTMMKTAKQSNDIVSSLFPSVVRNRLFQKEEEQGKEHNVSGRVGGRQGRKLRTFLRSTAESSSLIEDEAKREDPIADLFPDVSHFPSLLVFQNMS